MNLSVLQIAGLLIRILGIAGLAVWSVDHMVSPEVFHDFRLAPGETECWTREYRFDPCEG